MFKLSFSTDNAEFVANGVPETICRILRRLPKEIMERDDIQEREAVIMDINGNVIGKWKYDYSEEGTV